MTPLSRSDYVVLHCPMPWDLGRCVAVVLESIVGRELMHLSQGDQLR